MKLNKTTRAQNWPGLQGTQNVDRDIQRVEWDADNAYGSDDSADEGSIQNDRHEEERTDNEPKVNDTLMDVSLGAEPEQYDDSDVDDVDANAIMLAKLVFAKPVPDMG
jgi:hypothetical protein